MATDVQVAATSLVERTTLSQQLDSIISDQQVLRQVAAVIRLTRNKAA